MLLPGKPDFNSLLIYSYGKKLRSSYLNWFSDIKNHILLALCSTKPYSPYINIHHYQIYPNSDTIINTNRYDQTSPYVSSNSSPTRVLSTDPSFAPSMIPRKDPTYVPSHQTISPPHPDTRNIPSLLPTVTPKLTLNHILSSVPPFNLSRNQNSIPTSET